MTWYIWYDMIYIYIYDAWYDTIYLLTAIGLISGGSSTVHIYIQQYTEQQNETEHLERNIHNNKNIQYKNKNT